MQITGTIISKEGNSYQIKIAETVDRAGEQSLFNIKDPRLFKQGDKVRLCLSRPYRIKPGGYIFWLPLAISASVYFFTQKGWISLLIFALITSIFFLWPEDRRKNLPKIIDLEQT